MNESVRCEEEDGKRKWVTLHSMHSGRPARIAFKASCINNTVLSVRQRASNVHPRALHNYKTRIIAFKHLWMDLRLRLLVLIATIYSAAIFVNAKKHQVRLNINRI